MYDIGAKEVLEKLLPVVDNLERALSSIPEEDMDGHLNRVSIKSTGSLWYHLRDLRKADGCRRQAI